MYVEKQNHPSQQIYTIKLCANASVLKSNIDFAKNQTT